MCGISILIGVNTPAADDDPLTESEAHAWKMAGLAHQAGYQDIRLLLGPRATRETVRGAIASAACGLSPGDTLLVAYSGHGSMIPDRASGVANSFVETWCLADGDLTDDELAARWRLAPAGARIVLVSESCFGGGMGRGRIAPSRVVANASSNPPVRPEVKPLTPPESCIARAPLHDNGIAASVLILAAAGERRRAREGLYIRSLLTVWRDGAFRGSYCELHRQVRDRVRAKALRNDPQILMAGSPDLQFPLAPAFHLRESPTEKHG